MSGSRSQEKTGNEHHTTHLLDPDGGRHRQSIMGFGAPAHAQEKTLRIGYQKYGTLVLLKGSGILEEKLAATGYTVTWTEFPGGPQLLEALNVGAIDFGSTGEAPRSSHRRPARRSCMSRMSRPPRAARLSSFRRTARCRPWLT